MLNNRKNKPIYSIIAILLFLGIWQVSSMIVANDLFLPSAIDVATSFIKSFVIPIGRETMPIHIISSLYRVLVGFSLSLLVGILMGVGMGFSKTIESIFYPIFEFIRPIPPLAWIPMSIIWFGLSDMSKFFIIFLGSFSFVTLNTYEGTKNVDKELIGAALMLGASKTQVFFKVVLPAAVPDIFAGIQIGVTSAWSSVVGAEMVRSDNGVGWIIVRGMNKGDTIQIMVGMLAIGLVGFLLVQLTSFIERRLLVWNNKN